MALTKINNNTLLAVTAESVLLFIFVSDGLYSSEKLFDFVIFTFSIVLILLHNKDSNKSNGLQETQVICLAEYFHKIFAKAENTHINK